MVLLSRDKPEIAVLRPEGRDRFAELVEVADLRAGECVDAWISAHPVNSTDLEIELRLRPESPGELLQRRIEGLALDIEAKRVMVERLRQERESHRQTRDDRAPRPLYLYVELRADVVPHPLRRLLVEWSGLSEEVAALRYAKLDGGSLPSALRRAGAHVHVLTTKDALEISLSDPKPRTPEDEAPSKRVSGLGFLLQDYAPRGDNRRFEPAMAWREFGLRLFLPAGNHLTLYPELRPSAFAAGRLAGALFASAADARDHVALLMSGPDDAVVVWRIPESLFRSLTDEAGWNCTIEIGCLDSEARGSPVARSAEFFAESLEQALDRAAVRERDLRLGLRRREIEGQLALEERRLEVRFKQIQEIRETLNGLVETLGNARSMCRESLRSWHQSAVELEREVSGHRALLEQTEHALRGLKPALNQLRAAEQQLRSSRDKLSWLDGELARLLDG